MKPHVSFEAANKNFPYIDREEEEKIKIAGALGE
jgi:hypothetical protein